MQVHIHADETTLAGLSTPESRIREVLEQVAATTPTMDLVVLIALSGEGISLAGEMSMNWTTPAEYPPLRDRRRRWPPIAAPAGLPERFRIVRLHFGCMRDPFPHTTQIRTRKIQILERPEEEVALHFAHIFHSYRAHVLPAGQEGDDMRPEDWAIQRMAEIGLPIGEEEIPRPPRKPRTRRVTGGHRMLPRLTSLGEDIGAFTEAFLQHAARFCPVRYGPLTEEEHNRVEAIRALHAGARLRLRNADKLRHHHLRFKTGQLVTLLAPLPRGTDAAMARTEDGHMLCFPMEHLEPII